MRWFLSLVMSFAFAASALAQTYINTVGSDDRTAIAGFDVVAFHTDKKAVAGSPAHAHEHLGAKWLFSSAESLNAFRAEPDKYIPAWGGQCAAALAEAGALSTKKLNGDFGFHDGKLYLFAYGNRSRNGAKDWFMYGRVGKPMLVRDGDKSWPELRRQLLDGSLRQPTSADYRKSPYE